MHLTQIQCDSKGRLHLSFDDVAAVRADTVFIDQSSNQITAIIDGWLVCLGEMPQTLWAQLKDKSNVALNALHPQGHDLQLNAALQTF